MYTIDNAASLAKEMISQLREMRASRILDVDSLGSDVNGLSIGAKDKGEKRKREGDVEDETDMIPSKSKKIVIIDVVTLGGKTWYDIPRDVMFEIMLHMNALDIRAMCSVNKEISTLCTDNLWRAIFYGDYHEYFGLFDKIIASIKSMREKELVVDESQYFFEYSRGITGEEWRLKAYIARGLSSDKSFTIEHYVVAMTEIKFHSEQFVRLTDILKAYGSPELTEYEQTFVKGIEKDIERAGNFPYPCVIMDYGSFENKITKWNGTVKTSDWFEDFYSTDRRTIWTRLKNTCMLTVINEVKSLSPESFSISRDNFAKEVSSNSFRIRLWYDRVDGVDIFDYSTKFTPKEFIEGRGNTEIISIIPDGYAIFDAYFKPVEDELGNMYTTSSIHKMSHPIKNSSGKIVGEILWTLLHKLVDLNDKTEMNMTIIPENLYLNIDYLYSYYDLFKNYEKRKLILTKKMPFPAK